MTISPRISNSLNVYALKSFKIGEAKLVKQLDTSTLSQKSTEQVDKNQQ